MVGAFSNILNVISLGAKLSENADAVDITRRLNETKSISERAKKSIFVYPVLFSAGMSDPEIDFKVSKFLEIQYGIFTLMTVGLNPNIENGTFDQYLNSISAESLDNIDCKILNNRPDQIKSWYNLFSVENKDFFEDYSFSTEDDEKRLPSLKGDPFSETDDVNMMSFNAEKLTKKLTDADPTMISLRLKLRGYQDSFDVPIALKASPHFLRTDELISLFDSAIEDKRLRTRIVKLKSGEISFFKDFIFNMDRIKRDQELYKTFGQHPWYQQFTARKGKNHAKRVGIIASSLLDKGKGVVNSTSNYLPTASIIMTVDEFEKCLKLKMGFITKNDKIIWDILNQLGLLCIGIYSAELEMFTFYFSGFKKPLVMRLKDMSGGNSDPNAEMAKAMTMMLKRGLV